MIRWKDEMAKLKQQPNESQGKEGTVEDWKYGEWMERIEI